MFFKTGVLKNFAKFTEKHLCGSLFLIKLRAWPATLLKRDSYTDVFQWNLRNSKKSFFAEHHRWLLLLFLKQRRKNWKNICRLESLQFYKKGKPSQMVSMKFVKFLQNLNFTEDSWMTASDLQQNFGHITCSINNKST